MELLTITTQHLGDACRNLYSHFITPFLKRACLGRKTEKWIEKSSQKVEQMCWTYFSWTFWTRFVTFCIEIDTSNFTFFLSWKWVVLSINRKGLTGYTTEALLLCRKEVGCCTLLHVLKTCLASENVEENETSSIALFRIWTPTVIIEISTDWSKPTTKTVAKWQTETSAFLTFEKHRPLIICR